MSKPKLFLAAFFIILTVYILRAGQFIQELSTNLASSETVSEQTSIFNQSKFLENPESSRRNAIDEVIERIKRDVVVTSVILNNTNQPVALCRIRNNPATEFTLNSPLSYGFIFTTITQEYVVLYNQTSSRTITLPVNQAVHSLQKTILTDTNPNILKYYNQGTLFSENRPTPIETSINTEPIKYYNQSAPTEQYRNKDNESSSNPNTSKTPLRYYNIEPPIDERNRN